MIKRKIGKIISVAMASAMLFSMAACGGKGGEGMKPRKKEKITKQLGYRIAYDARAAEIKGGAPSVIVKKQGPHYPRPIQNLVLSGILHPRDARICRIFRGSYATCGIL